MLSMFNRLPCEIFRKIILYANVYSRNDHLEDALEDGIDLDFEVVLPPITASYVCRSWRQTLVSDPTLWTCIPLPQITSLGVIDLLPRSRAAALDVYLDLDRCIRRSDPDLLRMIICLFRQIHRFRLLHIRASGSSFYDSSAELDAMLKIILPYLERPAPRLQSFGLWIPEPLEQNTLFSGEATGLRQLHYEMSAEFSSSRNFLFHNLVKLDVTLQPGFEFNRFLDMLELCPGLKSLLLRGPCGWVSVPSSCDRQISFPSLEKFVLVKMNVLVGNLILRHITFPQNAKWHVIREPEWAHQVRLYPVQAFHSSPSLLPLSFRDYDLFNLFGTPYPA